MSSTNPDIDVNEDEDTSLHIEGFYQYQVTDNIAITLLSDLDYSA